MKILFGTTNSNMKNKMIAICNRKKYFFDISETKDDLLLHCTTLFYDIIVIDGTNHFPWQSAISDLRQKQVFTPILIIYSDDQRENRIEALKIGADIYIHEMLNIDEFELKINALHRRNTEYQSPYITYHGINLNRSDGKICFDGMSLSVSPIEIEIFRLLTRATKPISVDKLSKKINEPKDRICFFADCLKKKLGLLKSPIKLDIKDNRYSLKERCLAEAQKS